MSQPHPEGLAPLERFSNRWNGRVFPSDIDYVNLHGTATKANDLVEDKAVHHVFGSAPVVSSTKGGRGIRWERPASPRH